jgi:pimeloyl-ACP methyl ester carboxylesterase
MSTQENVQIVKDFFAALGRRDRQGLLALSAEDIEWIIPGEGWPLAGTHRGHAGLENVLQKANETVETAFPEPPEFVAQGDRVLVVGFATGKIKATNKTFEDYWVFAVTVRNGKLTNIREYVDTQALARASEMDESPRRPAVLVHGVPDTYRVWDRVRAQLTRKDVVALALPGFDNPAPAGFTSTKEAYADWIIQQLETIGTPVDLVGHDWGCMLTARVASIRPDLVRTWTGISGPIDPGYEWHKIAKIWQTPGEGERWMAELDLDAFAEQLTGNYRVPSEEARIAASHFDDAMKASILALYRSAVHVGAEWSPALANVAAPALVMWGIEDADVPHRFADSLGEATHARAVVKLRTAHWPFLEQPADVARELEAHWT